MGRTFLVFQSSCPASHAPVMDRYGREVSFDRRRMVQLLLNSFRP